MSQEKNALSDGTLADLFWKLRLRLTAEGKENIDIHQLRKDAAYREQWLKEADASADPELNSLATAIRQRLKEIDTGVATELPQTAGKTNKFAIIGAAAAIVAAVGLYFALGTSPKPAAPVVAASSPAPQADATPATPARTLFRIHGSNTVGEKLAPELVKSFLKSEGATQIAVKTTDVDVENYVTAELNGEPVEVEIHAHGSSTGFADLDKEVTDIAMSSRRIKGEEVELLASRFGDLSQVSSEHVLALDGLAVIVNPALAIEEMNTATIAELFSGKISNWSALGGPDLAVKIFARDANSGTWDTFESLVLKPNGLALSDSAQRFESSQTLSDEVATTPGAIGFIGLPYVRQSKLVAVSEGGEALPSFPTNFTVSTEDYPLARRLYLYLPATTTNKDAMAFVNFANSHSGQGVVQQVGLISQNIETIRPPVVKGLPNEYIDTTKGAERLSVNIRFETGSNKIDNKAQRDLNRIADFLSKHPERRVMLLGFTDNVGNPDINAKLSEERAKLVSNEIMKLGIYPTLVTGFGQVAPVASNDSEEGRLRNRRVEIWVI